MMKGWLLFFAPVLFALVAPSVAEATLPCTHHRGYRFHYSYYGSFPSYSSYSYLGWPYRSFAYRPYFLGRTYVPVPFCCSAPRYAYRPSYWSADSLPLELDEAGFLYSPTMEDPVPYFSEARAVYEPAKLYSPPLEIYLADSSGNGNSDRSEVISTPVSEPNLSNRMTDPSRVMGGEVVTGFQVPVRLLTPTSNDWADSAIGLTDLMIQDGDGRAAYDACLRMREIRQQLPTGIYLRHGLLSAVHMSSSEETVEAIQSAIESGSRWQASELPQGSIRAYLSGDSKLHLDDTIEALAKRALESNNAKDLLVLGSILRLDGQVDRAKPLIEAARPQLNPPLQNVADALMQPTFSR